MADPFPPPVGGRLTVAQGSALYVGAVLGTGVIALPALAAKAAGPASLLAWVGLVVLSVPLAATFAALGARHPDAGGVSTYARRAFGHTAGTLVGWCFFFAVPVGAPAAALFGGQYVAAALGGGNATAVVTAFGLIVAVGGANVFGLRVTARLQLALAVALVALMVTAVAVSLPHARTANLHPFAPHGYGAVLAAAALLVWSFAGWEAITHLAGEFRHPARDLARATGVALALVAVLYLGVALATVIVLGPRAATSHAPLADLLAYALSGAHGIAAVMALLLTAGTMNAYFAGAGKLGAALGRDGALPQWFARGSVVGDVPRRSSVVVMLGAALGLAVTQLIGVDVRPLVLLSSAQLATVYAVGVAAAVKLLPRRTPGHAAALLGLVAVLALLVAIGPYLVWPAVLALAAVLFERRRVTATPRLVGAP